MNNAALTIGINTKPVIIEVGCKDEANDKLTRYTNDEVEQNFEMSLDAASATGIDINPNMLPFKEEKKIEHKLKTKFQ